MHSAVQPNQRRAHLSVLAALAGAVLAVWSSSAASQDLRAAPSTTPPSPVLADQDCTPAVVQRTPGHFLA